MTHKKALSQVIYNYQSHQNTTFPMVFITESTDPMALRFELTGKTPSQLYEDHEIIVYSNVAKEAFDANFPADEFDTYAVINAALARDLLTVERHGVARHWRSTRK